MQGAGAALLMPLGLALLSAAFPPERRGAAIGIFSAITGLAVASGPLVGGAVVEGLAWQWIFWINVPIGLLAIPLVLTRMHESFGPDTSLDIRGLALVTGGALGLVWGLVRGNQAGWGSPEVVGVAAARRACSSRRFVAWELRAREPMLPMRFFRSRAFSAGNAAIFLTFASLFGAVFFYAQLLQTGLGYGPLGAGLRLMPWTATFMTVAPIAGALVDRIGERPFMVVGLTLQAAGLAWLALIAEPGMAYSQMLAPFIVGGVGVSMAIPAAQNSVVGSVADGAIGKAAGTNSMMRELGGVFGIALVVAVFAGAGSYASAQAFIDGFSPAILVAAALALAGAVAGLALPGRHAAPTAVVAPTRSGGSAMRRVMVRYKVKPDRAAENEALVRAVYEELARTQPAGLHYATFALEDGVSFVHLSTLETEDGRNPLSEVEAFARFQEGVGDRCEEGPVVAPLREVGSFQWP